MPAARYSIGQRDPAPLASLAWAQRVGTITCAGYSAPSRRQIHGARNLVNTIHREYLDSMPFDLVSFNVYWIEQPVKAYLARS